LVAPLYAASNNIATINISVPTISVLLLYSSRYRNQIGKLNIRS
jgi:hypothetical protein